MAYVSIWRRPWRRFLIFLGRVQVSTYPGRICLGFLAIAPRFYDVRRVLALDGDRRGHGRARHGVRGHERTVWVSLTMPPPVHIMCMGVVGGVMESYDFACHIAHTLYDFI